MAANGNGKNGKFRVGLWKNKGKDGNKDLFLSSSKTKEEIVIPKGTNIFVFFNKVKRQPRSPDYSLVVDRKHVEEVEPF